MVSQISRLLAEHAGYPPREVETIEQAALLHDVGKCGVPAEILTKPGALSSREYEIIKTHTQIGCGQITEMFRILSAAAIVAIQHHERLDGSGYIGLTGQDIDPYARLVAVADVFDALSSRRSYKEPWSQDSVCAHLKEQSSSRFDPEIVAVLLAHVNEIMTLYR